LDSLLEAPEALVDRIWNHELAAEPLATPEQKAGLRHRLSDHVSAIRDPHVREQYRSDLLGRFNALTAPPPRRPWTPGPPGRPGPRGGARFEPRRPVSDQAKALASGGISPKTARSVLHGLLRYPGLVAAHAEAIGALPLPDKMAARLRDALLEGAMAHGELDQERLHTILAEAGVAPLAERLRLERGLAFSFNRRDADPERASRDLVLVIDTLAAQPGLYAALDAATARLKEEGDEAAFQEQQRLRAARDEAESQLAALIESSAQLSNL
jgi:DNA primase